MNTQQPIFPKIVSPNEIIVQVNNENDFNENRVRLFLKFIAENPSFGNEAFDWYLKTSDLKRKNKKIKCVPLLIKYALWCGVNTVIPAEEICMIIFAEDSVKYRGTEQWWHGYADDGFDVLTSSQYYKACNKWSNIKGIVLLSTHPGPKAVTRARCIVDPLDFEKRKQEFNYRCACCGAEEGRFGGQNGIFVRLEAGHADPRKPYSHNNIIPQCPSCNNHSDDEIFGPLQDNPLRWVVIGRISDGTAPT